MLRRGEHGYRESGVVMKRRSWLSYTLVGASSAAAAVIAVLGATVVAPPPSLSPAGEATSAAVAMTEYRDERTVAAEIEAAQPVEASVGLAGTVTSSVCAAGGGIESGHVVASLNGRPVLGLHSAVPFYRDIGPGVSGADVDALRMQLKATGFDLQEKGGYGADLRAAILKIQTDLALKNRDGILHQDETVWLPADSVRVKSCNALLGSQYAPGSPFITIVGSVSSLRVVFPPGQPPAAGPRMVTFGNASALVSADGIVTDATLLAEVSRSSEFAVFGVQKDTACVKSPDGQTLPVTIAGSSAGSVLATFRKEVPKEILLGAAIGEKQCD
jgi:hypothetical protein